MTRYVEAGCLRDASRMPRGCLRDASRTDPYMCIPDRHCHVVVRWSYHSRPTSGGSTPPPCMCMPKLYEYALSRFVQIIPTVYPSSGMYMQGGGVDPPEVGRGRYVYMTTT
jgi:hypothetical protein